MMLQSQRRGVGDCNANGLDEFGELCQNWGAPSTSSGVEAPTFTSSQTGQQSTPTVLQQLEALKSSFGVDTGLSQQPILSSGVKQPSATSPISSNYLIIALIAFGAIVVLKKR